MKMRTWMPTSRRGRMANVGSGDDSGDEDWLSQQTTTKITITTTHRLWERPTHTDDYMEGALQRDNKDQEGDDNEK